MSDFVRSKSICYEPVQLVFTHKKESILQPFQNFHLRIPERSNLRPIQTGLKLEVLARIAFIGHCKFFPCHLLITHHQYLQCWQGSLHLPLHKVNSIWKLIHPADRPSKFKPAAASHFFQEDVLKNKYMLMKKYTHPSIQVQLNIIVHFIPYVAYKNLKLWCLIQIKETVAFLWPDQTIDSFWLLEMRSGDIRELS